MSFADTLRVILTSQPASALRQIQTPVLVSADSGPKGNVSFKRVTALISAETYR